MLRMEHKKNSNNNGYLSVYLVFYQFVSDIQNLKKHCHSFLAIKFSSSYMVLITMAMLLLVSALLVC